MRREASHPELEKLHLLGITCNSDKATKNDIIGRFARSV